MKFVDMATNTGEEELPSEPDINLNDLRPLPDEEERTEEDNEISIVNNELG
jgi:hypothetical protein